MPKRLEIIDHRGNVVPFGRVFIIPKTEKEFVVDISYQDDGQTIKIFLSDPE